MRNSLPTRPSGTIKPNRPIEQYVIEVPAFPRMGALPSQTHSRVGLPTALHHLLPLLLLLLLLLLFSTPASARCSNRLSDKSIETKSGTLRHVECDKCSCESNEPCRQLYQYVYNKDGEIEKWQRGCVCMRSKAQSKSFSPTRH